jgi:cell division transport system permease protein
MIFSVNFFRHLLRRSIRSIWENLYLNTVSSGVIGASLMLLGVYAIIHLNLNGIVDTWNRDVHVSAYFASDITQQERLDLRTEILALPEVTKVTYISEEDAQKWLIDRVEGVDASLEILGEDALPASLEITLESDSNADIIEDFATKIDRAEFDSVDYGVEWINRFNEFIQLLQVLGTLLGGLIVIAATFVVSNTIHLVVYNRRNELEITKLVGGSDMFILLPFLFEGAVQGIIGSFGAISILWLIHKLITARIQSSLSLNLSTDLAFLPIEYLLGLVALGVILGMIAASFATGRFLSRTT